jgi:putative PIN family toxin of toxin-antitoxin system
MRVVLDTNVLVSAALKRISTPAAAVGAVERGGVLLKSLATERQLFDVVARPYFVPLIGHETREWLQNLTSAAELVTVTERIAACRDPTDDKFLEPAVSGRADVIVSGDADLLALGPFRGIPIIPPAAFVQGAGP